MPSRTPSLATCQKADTCALRARLNPLPERNHHATLCVVVVRICPDRHRNYPNGTPPPFLFACTLTLINGDFTSLSAFGPLWPVQERREGWPHRTDSVTC